MNWEQDRFTAILDACVLVGVLRRDILLSLAAAGLFRPSWSTRILDETQKGIESYVKDHDVAVLQRGKIEEAFPAAKVTEYEKIEECLSLPDPDDTHVLAAAISISASVIVTDNLRHFPKNLLSPHNIEAMSADSFIADTIEISPPIAMDALRTMLNRFEKPEMNASELIRNLKSKNMKEVAATVKHYKKLL